MSTGEGQMSNLDLFQQVALLRWLSSDSSEDRGLLTLATGIRVAHQLLGRLTGQPRVDAYKKECILSVAQFVRENPRATPATVNAHVEKSVALFAARVAALDAAPLF
uniref:Si:ch211-191j22.3 n=1 Tax=Hippocampus comes TaxID=109280 RepID=A0A3Q3D1L8_HIPCM